MATPQEMLEQIETATSVPKRNGGLVLTDWETNFIDSITRQLDADKELTEKQLNILEGIWDRT